MEINAQVRCSWVLAQAALLLLLCGCDGVEPETEALLVVEGFFETGKPLSQVKISRAVSLNNTSDSTSMHPVEDATFRLNIDGETIHFAHAPDEPGYYVPVHPAFELVPAQVAFEVDIEWKGRRATTQDLMPAPIAFDSVWVNIPDLPVSAILIDTLRLDTPEVGARRGYIYPVEVTVYWQRLDPAIAADSLYWVDTQIRPQVAFSSKVLDVFLLSEEVQPETDISIDMNRRRSWTGVYAVPVEDSLSSVPDHRLTVQVVRGTEAYGSFASSRGAPDRREPISNIDGAIGVIAGISLDSRTVEIQQGRALFPSDR